MANPDTKQTAYRERIYQHYIRSFNGSLSLTSLDDLRSRAPYLNQLISRHFPPDRRAKILELGCGHGALIYSARNAGYQNITGVDRSPQQVDEAQKLGIEGVMEGELLETLRSLPDASQDVIVAFDVIEHFQKDEILELTDDVLRVLKKGGRWIIHCPNGESPFCGRIRYGDFSHECCFTRTSITQLLTSSGFSDVRCFEDAPVPHGVKSGIRLVCWKLIRGVLRGYLAVETGAGEASCIFSQNFLTIGIK